MNTKEQPIIIGLDIGTTKVVAIAGRKNKFGKLEILGFGKAESAGVNHGVVRNIDQCVHSIGLAIENCMASNPNLELNEVYVGIAGHHIKSLQSRGDRVRNNSSDDDVITKEDIDQLINDQYKTYIPDGDQIIDIIPQDFVVDNTPDVTEPIGMSGVKIGANFHIITGGKNDIRNIKRCVDKSNLKTIDLVLQPLASAAAVMSVEDLEAGVAIVDIGGGTTDIAIFHDGVLRHTAVIPYAGTNITNDIRQGLGVLRNQAEAMKVQFGMALANEANTNAYITIPGLRGLPPKEISVKNLAHIIEARVEEILDYLIYHLKQCNMESKLHGGIILTGGGSKLQHILQLTEFKTGLSARMGLPNEHLAGGHSEALKHPMYATCIGLILRGYSDFENGKYLTHNSNKESGMNKDSFIKVNIPEEPFSKHTKSQESTMHSDSVYEDVNVKKERSKKRSDMLTKVFNQIKNSFMSIFEEPGDQKM